MVERKTVHPCLAGVDVAVAVAVAVGVEVGVGVGGEKHISQPPPFFAVSLFSETHNSIHFSRPYIDDNLTHSIIRILYSTRVLRNSTVSRALAMHYNVLTCLIYSALYISKCKIMKVKWSCRVQTLQSLHINNVNSYSVPAKRKMRHCLPSSWSPPSPTPNAEKKSFKYQVSKELIS